MDYRSLIDFFIKKISKDNISAYAAQAALFIIMSMIPFLLVFLSLLRFTPITETMLAKGVSLILPESIAVWMEHIIREVYNNSANILWIAIVFAVYSAAKCIHSLRNGLNTVYEVKETRNWFKLRARAMLETLLLILLILLSMLLVFFGRKIQRMLEQYFPHMRFTSFTGVLVNHRLIVMFFALIVVFTFIYKVLPNRPATFRSQLVGAVGCSVAWYFFTFGLSFVINFLNGFSLYGSMTTIVVVMFWLYICMSIFLICGEVNNAFEMIVAEFRMARAKKRTREYAEKKRNAGEKNGWFGNPVKKKTKKNHAAETSDEEENKTEEEKKASDRMGTTEGENRKEDKTEDKEEQAEDRIRMSDEQETTDQTQKQKKDSRKKMRQIFREVVPFGDLFDRSDRK